MFFANILNANLAGINFYLLDIQSETT
jgi:hypothetical protein